MRAVLFAGVETIEVTTLPDPAPGPGEVVVASAGAGICGTDVHILAGEVAPLPIVPGHESAGEVVALGEGVEGLRVGDQVAVNPSINCGHCRYCQRGRPNLCVNWQSIGITRPGGAAEYSAVPAGNCYVLPDGVATADAVLVEPLACAVRGFDVLPRTLADHYLIYGAGTMGLMMLELAKRAGAATVSVVELQPERLATARLLGCTAAVTSADELDRPHGWDVVIDCTGVVAAIEDGLPRVDRGGTFLQFGVATPEATARFRPHTVYNQEITIAGSMAILNTFERARDLFAAGVLRPDVLISDRFPLEEYEAAMALFRAGTGRKLLVSP